MMKSSRWTTVIVFAVLALFGEVLSQNRVVSADAGAMMDEGFGPVVALFRGGGGAPAAPSSSFPGAGDGALSGIGGPQKGVLAENSAQVTFGALKRAYLAGEQLSISVSLDLSQGMEGDLYAAAWAPGLPHLLFFTGNAANPLVVSQTPVQTNIPSGSHDYLVFQSVLPSFPQGLDIYVFAVLVEAEADLTAEHMLSSIAQTRTRVIGSAEDTADRNQTGVLRGLRGLAGPGLFQATVEQGALRHLQLDLTIPKSLLPAGTTVDQLALALLSASETLLRVEAPRKSFRLQKRAGTEVQTLTFAQYYRDVPVYGAGLQMTFEDRKEAYILRSIHGHYTPDLQVQTIEPEISSQEAVIEIMKQYGVGSLGEFRRPVPVKLWIFDEGLFAPDCPACPEVAHNPRLAWRVVFESPKDGGIAVDAFVDALNASALLVKPRSDWMEMQIWGANGNQLSSCMDRNDAVNWLDESGVCEERGACDYRNYCWWDGNLTCADPDAEGYDASDYTHLIHRFYSEVFGRRSYDDHNSVYRVYLDVGFPDGPNAFAQQCGAYEVHKFSDGYAVIDVLAHEFGHSFHWSEARYDREQQSGAIAEHIADMFSHYVAVWSGVDPNWLAGEEISTLIEDRFAGGFWGGGNGNGRREWGEQCGNGADDDSDGFVDEGCPERDAQCGDGIDNDGDGRVDEGCPETGSDCGNLADDDGDGFADEGCPNNCDDGIDNGDRDGFDDTDGDCFIRSLSDPPMGGDPDHMNEYLVGASTEDEDFGWVHSNSTILSKAAYLMTVGGTHPDSAIPVTGIGEEKSMRIYYRLVTNKLDRNDDFSDLASKIHDACNELIGQHGIVAHDCCQVRNAFAAIGLGTSDVDCDGTGDDVEFDDDDDGVLDGLDNCPLVPNPTQRDRDGDGLGDACDPDMDNDGRDNAVDNCPRTANAAQLDRDGDGTGDVCDDSDGDGIFDSPDNCPEIRNRNQADQNRDGEGDVCDNDIDGDSIANATDNCPELSNVGQLDDDVDGVGNSCDNCLNVSNPSQTDIDGDSLGDACDDDMDGDGILNAEDNCPESFTASTDLCVAPPGSVCGDYGCPPTPLLPEAEVRMHFNWDRLEGAHPAAIRPVFGMALNPCGVIDCQAQTLFEHDEYLELAADLKLNLSPNLNMESPVSFALAVINEEGYTMALGETYFISNASVQQTQGQIVLSFRMNPSFTWRDSGKLVSSSGAVGQQVRSVEGDAALPAYYMVLMPGNLDESNRHVFSSAPLDFKYQIGLKRVQDN